MRPVTDPIPEHLLPFIAEQDMSQYTAINHATWRYTLRIAQAFFKKHAHEKYLAGLDLTGISIEEIPAISDMDLKLRSFGWRAVPVSGFIPPAIFMEFQSLGILPIACDIRTTEHLAYTPAPDIIHEAAGHAPIIADEEYAEYLRHYGEVAQYAIFSKQDLNVYEAIRALSDIKEDPDATIEDIDRAQKALDYAISQQTYVSEASYLSRMSWWTTEYGLVGNLEKPKIFGAGLLSSVGESAHCLSDHVKHVPLTLDCVNMSYDITRPQPQLFVTPDFPTLTKILDEFSKTMAYRSGGLMGISKALLSESVCTLVIDDTIQVSGVLSRMIESATSDGPAYLKFSGPCQLGHRRQQLADHGPENHHEGFGLPLGLPLDWNSPTKVDELRIGSHVELILKTGVAIKGTLKKITKVGGLGRIATLDDASVSLNGQTLFEPSWGSFDWVIGTTITSVFGGATDRAAYLKSTGGLKAIKKPHLRRLSPEEAELNGYFERTRELRKQRPPLQQIRDEVDAISAKLIQHYPDHWLCHMELIELDPVHSVRSRAHLAELSRRSPDLASLIERGLNIL